MTGQKGKISIGAIIVLLIIGYGGFVAVKFISAGFTETHVDNEISQALFIRQGSDFTPAQGEEVIKDILDKNGVFYDDENEDAIFVSINTNTMRVNYYVEYEIDINLLFIKKTKFVKIDKILAR